VPEISNYMDIYSALDFLSALHEQGTDQNWNMYISLLLYGNRYGKITHIKKQMVLHNLCMAYAHT
jgi:hypothetical protein